MRPYAMEPEVGLEPTACRLRSGCSTTELLRHYVKYLTYYIKKYAFYNAFFDFGAGEEDRTPVLCLGSRCTATVLHPQN